MKDILYDIELDFYELKLFLENLDEKSKDKKLQEVALRAVENLSKRMDSLKKELKNISIADADSKPTTSNASVSINSCRSLDNQTPTVRNIPNQTEDITRDNIFAETEVESNTSCQNENDAEISAITVDEEVVNPPILPTEEEKISKMIVPGTLYRALTLNDVFYYTKELYAGNSIAFKEDIRALEEIGNYQESIDYLLEKLKCDAESDVFQSFDQLLQKFFNVR